MSTITIDRNKAIELLNNAVAEKGEDYRYMQDATGGCQYVRDGAPSCIVGHALHEAGVDLDLLAAYDRREGGMLIGRVIREGIHGYEFTEGAIRLLRFAQGKQDDGVLWGTAVNSAIDMTAGDE